MSNLGAELVSDEFETRPGPNSISMGTSDNSYNYSSDQWCEDKMATHFSANQYENAFAAKRLQNWQIPCKFKEHPAMRDGFTRPISNERGHLLPGVKRSTESPWGTFQGTWHEQRDCSRTKHCQTLTVTKSREASCLKDEETTEQTTQQETGLSKSKADTRSRSKTPAQSSPQPVMQMSENRVASSKGQTNLIKRTPTPQKSPVSPSSDKARSVKGEVDQNPLGEMEEKVIDTES